MTVQDAGGRPPEPPPEPPSVDTGARPTRATEAATSRERLIDAAIELALDHHESYSGARDVFAYMTPGAVAERAGVSRGLIYHHWGDPDVEGETAFTAFLNAVTARLWEMSAAPEDLAAAAELLPDRLSDVLLALVSYEVDRFQGRDRALFAAAQALTVHGVWPRGAPQEVVDRLADLYEALGGKLGLEPVPPLTFADVGFAVMCQLEGFGILQHVLSDMTSRTYDWTPHDASGDENGSDEGEPSAGWPLAAIAIEGIVRNMTRPVAAD